MDHSEFWTKDIKVILGTIFHPILMHFFCKMIIFKIMCYWLSQKNVGVLFLKGVKITTLRIFERHIEFEFFIPFWYFFSLNSLNWEFLLFPILFKKKDSKRGPNFKISHIWKEYLGLEIVKHNKFPKYSKLLSPAYHYVQLFTVSSEILCPLLLLIYICSTAVVSCFALRSPFFIENL